MSKKSEQTKKILDEYQMNWGFNYKLLVRDIRRIIAYDETAYQDQFNRDYNIEVVAWSHLIYFITLEVRKMGYPNYICKYRYLDSYNRDYNCLYVVIDSLTKEIANERIRVYERDEY